MDIRQAGELVIAMNQYDPRVQSNAIADAVWHDALKPFTRDVAWAAILEHFRLNENVMPTPATIRKRASAITEREAAKQRAIQATREREALGAHATPIQVAELRRSLQTVLKAVN